jgi:peptide/nickel transport system permease protein
MFDLRPTDLTGPRIQAETSTTGIPVGRPRSWRPRVTLVLRCLPALTVVVAMIAAPTFETFNPKLVAGLSSLPPSGRFLFGTDSSGLDVYSRTIAAFRVDVVIGLLVTLLSSAAGLLIGLTAGMNEAKGGLNGVVARGLARVLDLLQAVPAVVLGLVVVTFFGANDASMIFSLTLILVPIQARLVRTEALRVRGEAYLDGARIGGMSELALTVRHVLPNSSWPAVENAPAIFGFAITLTAALGFLGVGLPPPTAEWGLMISTAASDAESGRWWSFTFPALALTYTVLAAALLSPSGIRSTSRRS